MKNNMVNPPDYLRRAATDMSEQFKIKYDQSRFPMRQKREDGSWGCRGCGGEIPKNRKAWCSRACVKRYDPGTVIRDLIQREKYICQLCGLDCHKAMQDWKQARSLAGFKHWDGFTSKFTEWRNANPKPPEPEYDHIVPFSEGGLTVPENMRTLCATCHRKVTADYAARRARARAERLKTTQQLIQPVLF